MAMAAAPSLCDVMEVCEMGYPGGDEVQVSTLPPPLTHLPITHLPTLGWTTSLLPGEES